MNVVLKESGRDELSTKLKVCKRNDEMSQMGWTESIQDAKPESVGNRHPPAADISTFARQTCAQSGKSPRTNLAFCLMSLLDSPSLSTASSPLARARLDAEAYVLSIASLPSLYAASSSAPTNAIHLFDKASLRSVQQLPAHDVAISALRSVDDFAGSAHEVLVSCGKDGAVKIWDERMGSMALQCK